MATASQVKTAMDAIAGRISSARSVMEKVKSNAALASADLAAIPTDFADVLATIDAYAAGSTDYFERTAKAEKAKLAAEFTALKGVADQVAAANLG